MATLGSSSSPRLKAASQLPSITPNTARLPRPERPSSATRVRVRPVEEGSSDQPRTRGTPASRAPRWPPRPPPTPCHRCGRIPRPAQWSAVKPGSPSEEIAMIGANRRRSCGDARDACHPVELAPAVALRVRRSSMRLASSVGQATGTPSVSRAPGDRGRRAGASRTRGVGHEMPAGLCGRRARRIMTPMQARFGCLVPLAVVIALLDAGVPPVRVCGARSAPQSAPQPPNTGRSRDCRSRSTSAVGRSFWSAGASVWRKSPPSCSSQGKGRRHHPGHLWRLR